MQWLVSHYPQHSLSLHSKFSYEPYKNCLLVINHPSAASRDTFCVTKIIISGLSFILCKFLSDLSLWWGVIIIKRFSSKRSVLFWSYCILGDKSVLLELHKFENDASHTNCLLYLRAENYYFCARSEIKMLSNSINEFTCYLREKGWLCGAVDCPMGHFTLYVFMHLLVCLYNNPQNKWH